MYEWILIIAGYTVTFAAIMYIVMERREPTATLAWVVTVVLLPYVGLLLYLLIGRRRLNRQVRKRLVRASAIEPHIVDLMSENPNVLAPKERSEQKPRKHALVRLTYQMGCRQPTPGNLVKLLVDAPMAYDDMEASIRGAKKHIHLLYYIYQEDETGRRFRDLLTAKAKQGVEVRVLTDGIGSFGVGDFMKPLIAAGGEHADFLPVNIFRKRWAFNLRNHRKIAVIDGEVGYTGGVNIGDEYVGRKKKIGYWRDTNIKVNGPAVDSLQEIFAEDWFFATGKEPKAGDEWFPAKMAKGESTVQIIGSGPDTDTQSIQRIFFTAIATAVERVFLTVPYFVPDEPMLVALITAALRGVDVRILLPSKSDMPIVLFAGRSYYDVLLNAGVRIYEYKAGVLHAKTMVVDDDWATVGSANMDIRSFKLNFEANAIVFGSDFAAELAGVFLQDLAQAEELKVDQLSHKSIAKQVAENLARTLSPLL